VNDITPSSRQRLTLFALALTTVCYYGSDSDFIKTPRVLIETVLAIGLLILAVWLAARPAVRSRIGELLIDAGPGETVPSAGRAESAGWLLAGLGVVIAYLAAIEAKQPYFFTQDDNFSQFLPVTVQASRALFAGQIFTWNPDQWLGAPVADVSTYSLTYPPLYLSYWAARHLLHHEYATYEVNAVLHLLAGYGVTWAVLRRMGVRPMLAAAGGVSFALSGYAVMAGRSWYYMLPGVVWAPLLFGMVNEIRRGGLNARWSVLTGLVIGAFFHAGNAQMWTYGLMFFVLAVAVFLGCGVIARPQLRYVAAALALGLALAAPLMIPTFAFIKTVTRVGGQGGGILPGLLSLLLPHPLAGAAHPDGWNPAESRYMGQLYYSGTLFMAAALFAFAAFAAYRWPRRAVADNVWLVPAALAFLLALGHEGILWDILAHFPPFNKFNHPFKFLLFLNLAAVLTGAAILERAMRRGLIGKSAGTLAAGCVLAMMLVQAWLPLPPFVRYQDKPYPPLPAALAAALHQYGAGRDYRIASYAPSRGGEGGNTVSLDHNYPTVYGIHGLRGYDPLVRASSSTPAHINDQTPEAWRRYGVALVLTTLSDARPPAPPQITPVADPDPLAFASDRPREPLTIAFTGSGGRIAVPARTAAGDLVINFADRPALVTRLDGRIVPHAADTWGRIVVAVPAGSHAVEFGYAPDWKKGTLIAIALLAVAIGLLVRRGVPPD
jgi:hypothetical protein